MARVSQEELARLRGEVLVEDLARERGVELTKRGSNLYGLCPFHDDTSPSLVVTPSKNLWHCLGACNKGGSVIDWVMYAEGVSFRHAVEVLRKYMLAASVLSRPPKLASGAAVSGLRPTRAAAAACHR